MLFDAPPADYVPNDAELDLHTRWVPSPLQFRVAAALLDQHPTAYAVLVPLALPGKAHGLWDLGQPVEHPAGFWLAHDRSASYSVARDHASHAAVRHLAQRPGQPSYAIIHRGDRRSSMFEDFRGIFADDPVRD